MALADEVVSRYPAAYLTNLTNPGSAGASSYDQTRLGKACTDVEALVRIHAGTTFDVTDARHVATCCPIVISLLECGLGKVNYSQVMETAKAELRNLGLVTGRDKVTPTTSSQLTPSSDLDDGETSRGPAFDRTRFRDTLLDAPPADTDL